MVLVLALPAEIASRDILVAMTFGVVVLSVILQGSTMSWLLRRLDLIDTRSTASRLLGILLARLRAIDSQQKALDAITSSGATELPAVAELRNRLDGERESIVQELRRRQKDPEFAVAGSARAAGIYQHLCEVSRDSYRHSIDDNLIDDEEAARLFAATEDGDPIENLVEWALEDRS